MFYSARQVNRSAWQKMLDELIAPYNKMPNYKDFVEALQEKLTEEECEMWWAFPDYSYNTRPATMEEAKQKIPFVKRDRLEALTPGMVQKAFVVEKTLPGGEKGYYRNYFFGIYLFYLYYDDGSKLSKAFHQWWMDVADGGQSAKLNRNFSAHRVIPNEATVTGDASYGKIPMNLEIPDKREVVTMDRISKMLKKVDKIAVQPCVCRTEQEKAGQRQCDFPIENVCFTFDGAAEDVVEGHFGHYVTYEEAIATIQKCGDMGMVHCISDAEYPLALCNCCSCCCLILKSIGREEVQIGSKARYIAEVAKPDACVHCGKCVKSCQMGAFDLETGSITEACIGCGVCVSQCPTGALALTVRKGAPSKPTSVKQQRIYV